MGKGEPPTCAVPLFSPSAKIHPSVALWKDKGVSPSAEGDRRSRRLRRAFEKARAKLPADTAVKSPTNQNLKLSTKTDFIFRFFFAFCTAGHIMGLGFNLEFFTVVLVFTVWRKDERDGA